MPSFTCEDVPDREGGRFCLFFSPQQHEWLESVDVVALCDDTSANPPVIQKLYVEIWRREDATGERVAAIMRKLRGLSNLTHRQDTADPISKITHLLGGSGPSNPEYVSIDVSAGRAGGDTASQIETTLNNADLALPDDMKAAIMDKLHELWPQVVAPQQRPRGGDGKGRGR